MHHESSTLFTVHWHMCVLRACCCCLWLTQGCTHHVQVSGNGKSISHPQTLHQCFALREPSNPDHVRCLKALSIIAGGSINVLVVDTLHQATQMLDSEALNAGKGGKIRIWPLDRLTSSDRTALQRRAQAELAPGTACFPSGRLNSII